MKRLAILVTFVLGLAVGQDGGKLWILLENASINSCRDVENKVLIDEKDVSVTDKNGCKVNYIEAPGEYNIRFKNMRVTRPLPNLSGELAVTVQVPLVEGPFGINWDFPYQAVPEDNLINKKCDAESGVVTGRNNKLVCRYCDLCRTSDQVEQQLNQKFKYLPEVGEDESSFSPACKKVSSQTYEIVRTVKLPSKEELERQANEKYSGIGGDLKKRLNRGKGKMEVTLNLLTSDQTTTTLEDFLKSDSNCRCCYDTQNFFCRALGSFACKAEECRKNWAQSCLRGRTDAAACYTVVYNYRVTDNFNEVEAFLRQKNLPIIGSQCDSTTAGAVAKTEPTAAPTTAAPTTKAAQTTARAGNLTQRQQNCVNVITKANVKQYCLSRWRDSFCCSQCPGQC